MAASLSTLTVRMLGAADEEIPAYFAGPADGGTRAGVVVIHDLFGYDVVALRTVVRLASLGYDVICPNLFWREAPGASPRQAASIATLNGGVPDERAIGDVAGARAYLRALPSSNGKVGIVGFGAGAREAVLAACRIEFDAAVDCYGQFIVGTPPDGAFPFSTRSIVAELPKLGAPLLGLFGAEDTYPSRAHVAELDEILDEEGKPHEFHSYGHTAHAFMSPEKASYRVSAANDAWERIAAFLGRHLEAATR
jgi:carboxymethylenebutenolidase